MRRIRRFVRLSRSDKWLLIRTGLLLWSVRLGLWLLPYEKLCRLLFRAQPARSEVANVAEVKRIVRSVMRMSRYVPVATCLTKALAAMVLLEEAGQPACLQIGVAKSEVGNIEAHAWVECDGRVILGGTHAELSRYTILRPV